MWRVLFYFVEILNFLSFFYTHNLILMLETIVLTGCVATVDNALSIIQMFTHTGYISYIFTFWKTQYVPMNSIGA